MSTESLKNVVVVGAATAGVQLAHALAKSLPPTHRVVLIEANPVAYWSIGALRAAVQPGFEDQVLHDLSTQSIFGHGSRHTVLASTRVVDLKPDHVLVSRDVTASLPGSALDSEGRTQIPADRIALAVGADYAFPARISPSATTKEDVLEHFRQMQKEIKASSEILVIGGGPTGVEFVGEVLDLYPQKKVTLLTRGSGLVTNGKDAFAGLSNKLISQLKTKGVQLIFDDSLATDNLRTGPLSRVETFTTSKGATITADYVLISSGGRPNTHWIQALDPSIIDSSGHIKVTPTFSIDSPNWARYYAIGDAANTPGPKTSFMAGQHAPALAHNIVSAIRNQPVSKLKKAAPPPGNMIVVPLGKSGGASHLMFFSAGSWTTSLMKGKTLFLSNFKGWFSK